MKSKNNLNILFPTEDPIQTNENLKLYLTHVGYICLVFLCVCVFF